MGTTVQAWQCHPDGPDGCPPAIRRRGLRARDRMVASNLRLVLAFSRRWRTRVKPSDLLDLISEGNLGLIEAVEKFDPTKGYRLSTYAFWWIKKSMDAWSNQNALMIRPPSTQAPLMHQIRVATREHQRQHGSAPVTREYLAGALNVRPERIAEVLERAELAAVISTDLHWQRVDPTGDPMPSIADTIAMPPPADDPAEVDAVRAALATLDASTRHVMEALHGIGQEEITATQFATREGMRRSVVRKLAAAGEAQLRAALSGAEPPRQPQQPAREPASEAPQGACRQHSLFTLAELPPVKSKPHRPKNPARRQLNQPAHPGCCQPELFALAS